MALLRIGGAPGRARGGAPLLAAPANVAAPPITQQPAVDPSTLGDADFARWWVAPLTMGLNMERWRPVYMSWRGNALKTSTAYWEYLKGVGITHIRVFIPYRPTQDMLGAGWINATRPPVSAINEMLDVCETIVLAGLKCHLDCTDVVGGGDFGSWRSLLETHVDVCGQQIALRGAARLPATMFAVGPYNELELDPGTETNDIRLAGHRILRTRLPGYVIPTGAALWMQPRAILDPSWVMVPDRRTFIQWHDYTGPSSASYLQSLDQQYATLSAANGGVPIISGEAAVGSIGFEQAWVSLCDLYATYMPLGRPNWWAVNDGGYYNWGSSGSDPTLRPELEAAVRSAVAKIKAAPAWVAQLAAAGIGSGSGSGGGTTTPGTGTGGGTGTTAAKRGRPQIAGSTVKSDIGTPLRGATMALDGPGSLATSYTSVRSNWQMFRDLGFNSIRVPFSIAQENVTLAQQLPGLDAAVANAAATGMYCMLMLDQAYGVADYAELRAVWPTVCARYKDETHVFFEMNNEPHWSSGEHGPGELDSIAEVYRLMRAAAPATLIGVLTPATVDPNTAGVVSAAQGLVARGVPIGTSVFVAFHAYGVYTRASVQALKNAFPCLLTETVSGGPSNHVPPDDEVYKVQEMEALGISWHVLQARFGEISNRDTPYSNDQTTLTQRILPGVRAAGITWAQDPLGTTQPPTGGAAPVIVSVVGDLASAVVGQTTVLTVTTTSLTAIQWTIVTASYAWRADPVVVAVGANGVTTLAFVPVAAGDFVKVMSATDQSIYLDSAPVPTPAGGGTGGGGTTPAPNANSFYEDFASNTSGQLNHIWGNRNAVSFSNGVLRVQGIAGLDPGSTACGVMGFPGGRDWWFGYGFYELRIRMGPNLGDGSGPACGLWASDDSWPNGEDDTGEISRDNVFYMAHHYPSGNNNDTYQIFDKQPHDWQAWHTYACKLERGRTTFYVDGQSIGTTTTAILPTYADGGINRTFFIMNRSSNTWIECDWVRFTPA